MIETCPEKSRQPKFGECPMFNPLRKSILISIMLFSVLLISGCVTVNQRVDLLYEPTGTAKGGFGEFNLTEAPDIRPHSGEKIGGQWVLGNIFDKDGEKVANVVTSRSPNDLIIDVFSQELKSSGYKAVQVIKSLPTGVGKGLRIVDVKIDLDKTTKLFMSEATCSVKITVQPWRDGNATNTLKYEAVLTTSKITDRDRIVTDILQKTLQKVMAKAMPEIVGIIEQK